MYHTDQELIEKGLTNKRESKYVEFKAQFDGTTKAWCGLVKELIALANTKGGVIVYGLESGGEPSGRRIQPLLDEDPEVVVDKVDKYTGVQYDSISFHERDKDGETVLALVVQPAGIPIPFEQEGGYQKADGGHGTAFEANQVYFRHGAKSEPGTRQDFRAAFERRLDRVRDAWMEGVSEVVQAPPGSTVAIGKPSGDDEELPERRIRVVDDPTADVTKVADPDVTHPYRFMDVVEEIQDRLPDDVRFNQYDLMAVREVHGLMEKAEFVHEFEQYPAQYSERVIEWILDQYQANNDFFVEARRQFKQ